MSSPGSSRTGAAEETRPIFVFGCARSGTSLVSRILNRHPNIAVPFECHVFNAYAPLLRLYGDLGERRNRERLVTDVLASYPFRHWQPRPDPRAVLDEVEGDRLADVFDAILETWTHSVGKRRWGEKSPKHIEYWEQLRAAHPDAQVVHVVRDGRDVAVSLLRARFGPKTVFKAAEYWRDYLLEVDHLKRSTRPEDVFEMRYEELVSDPAANVRALCEFLNEPYSDDLLRYYEGAEPYPTDDRNLENLRRPILRDNTGGWRSALSGPEVGIFESVAGEMLERYGYDCQAPRQRLSPAREAYLRWLQSPPRRLVAMLKNRRGHVEAWIMLRIRARLIARHVMGVLAGGG
jgi:hypothetical protein